MLTKSKFHGRAYSREEIRSTISLLLHGGLDTVTNILSFIVKFLVENKEQADFIRGSLDDPKAMHQIVQELLRRFSVPNMARIVAQDLEYEGVTLKKGDMIILPPSIYNQDADRIEKPDVVDFSRSNVRHISFGSGPHTCAGALLAREEILVFLQEWLTRMPACRLDPTRPPRMQALPNNTVRELWLTWDNVAAA